MEYKFLTAILQTTMKCTWIRDNWKLYKLIWRKSKLSLKNKLTVYKVIQKPMWTYSVQLYETGSAFYISKLHILVFQWKTLQTIVKKYHMFSKKPSARVLNTYPESNIILINLLSSWNNNTIQRLKRRYLLDIKYRH